MLRAAENSTALIILSPRNSGLAVSDPSLEPTRVHVGYMESETEQEEGKEGPAEMSHLRGNPSDAVHPSPVVSSGLQQIRQVSPLERERQTLPLLRRVSRRPWCHEDCASGLAFTGQPS